MTSAPRESPLSLIIAFPENAGVLMAIHLRPYRLFGLIKGQPIEIKSAIRWRSVEANRIGFEFKDLAPGIEKSLKTLFSNKLNNSSKKSSRKASSSRQLKDEQDFSHDSPRGHSSGLRIPGSAR